MFLSKLGQFPFLPFLNADGGGGGGDFSGGDSNAGIGGGDANSGGDVSATPDVPDAIELDPDRYIRIKGQDKPIKFSEYGRNFQAQATRASQEAARLKQRLQALEQERQQWQQQQQVQPQTQPNGQQTDVFADLAKLPYLNGEQAATMARSIADQIKQRDMVTLGILKKFQALEGVVNQLNGAHVNSRFEGTISNAMRQVGIPDHLSDWAKEIYLAYEGDDLDVEYPTILQNRWNQLKAAIAQEQKAAAEAAKARRWVPGAGGNARPSQPLQFKGNESARDIAESLWDTFQESGT